MMPDGGPRLRCDGKKVAGGPGSTTDGGGVTGNMSLDGADLRITGNTTSSDGETG